MYVVCVYVVVHVSVECLFMHFVHLYVCIMVVYVFVHMPIVCVGVLCLLYV